MRVVKKWWWLAVSLVVGAALVWMSRLGGAEAGVPTAREQAPRPAAIGVTPPTTGRSREKVVAPSASGPEPDARPVEARETTAAQYRLPPGTQLKSGTVETPWEWIAPASIGDAFRFEEARQFVAGVSPITRPRFRRCAARYVPPPALEHLEEWSGMVVLDIESSAEGYEIVNASISDAAFGDPDLESCLREVYRDVRAPAVGVAEPGLRYRLKWPVRFGFGVKEEMPAVPESEG